MTLPNDAVTRQVGARWFLPGHDEWYKAAYHKNDGTGAYFAFPTSSDATPSRARTNTTPRAAKAPTVM